MSLPDVNLDDRKFQDIVDDVKRQIGLRCPEWTEHNVSDPGVTLIELFAQMTEMTLFRLNQVPEKNYRRFLELLGISLEPATPARTDLHFRLSRPIEDEDGQEPYEVTLPAHGTVAATVRTETEEALEFSTEVPAAMVRPRLRYVLAAPHAPDSPAGTLPDPRAFTPGSESRRAGSDDDGRSGFGHGFPIFGESPREGDALYIGFEADVSANIVQLDAECNRSAAVGLNEDYPAQVWEVWNGKEGRWDRLDVTDDTTFGFNRTGRVEVPLPTARMEPRRINDLQAYWIRCRYTTAATDLPPRGPQQLKPAAYQRSPEIFRLAARTVGGVAPASNCITIRDEVLGQSDGTPGQVFHLRHDGILARASGETIFIGPTGAARAEATEWTEVKDFSDSAATDPHFVCDAFTGEIFFGPNVTQPDGSAIQHGAIPPKGHEIVFSAYRHGGGIHGNVRENQIRILKSSFPYIAEVYNPAPASEGRDAETLERAKMRGRASLRVRERAVTPEDYEYLAQRLPGVGRARCVQPDPVHSAAGGVPPGVVRVLIVPALDQSLRVPRPADLRVPAHTMTRVYADLDQRRLLTAVLEVAEPDYVYVSTDIQMVADPKADADAVARAVRERLEEYLHPLRGGPDGEGWPFRRALTLADVYAQVGGVRGVAFLLNARIYESRAENRAGGAPGKERKVDNTRGVQLGPHELLCTREHRIRVLPMSSVGRPTDPED